MGSFLVIGMGRFGSSLATELHRMKHEVLAMDSHEDNVAEIMDRVTNVVIGDAKDEAVLRSLGVPNFDCAVVAIAGTIEDSILTTMILKDLGARMIVCKAQDERHERILSQLGADRVIRPEYDMGKRAAHSLARRNIIDYLELSPDYGVMEMVTPKHWAEKSIVQNHLRRKHGVTVIAVRAAETGKIAFSPDADTVLRAGDILTVFGSRRHLDAVGALK
ncbi:MAG: TrkA family potassium uptake protein [Oscillospiraceae bacterium]|nr:TrkA family potassium uptake protein [Oscillospiraceae bacterium]